jgi:hypothetical protein
MERTINMKIPSHQKLGVLFLDSTKFDLFLPQTNAVISYSLPPLLVRDLEILDKESLAKEISTFIDTNKVSPMSLIIALSERVLFSRDFANTADLQEQVNIVQDFLDTIPFDNLSTKTFKLEKGFKVVAANRDFYENIKESFETKNFIVDAVAPITIVDPNFATLTLLDKQTAQKVLAKLSTLKQNALEIHYESTVVNPKKQQEAEDKKAYKIRLYAMIGVFAILFIIMGVMLYQTFKPQPQSQASLPSVTQSPTPTLPLTPTTSPDIALKKTLQISITNPARASTLSATLQSNLLSAGFDNVQVATQSTSSTRTRIIFKTTVPSTLREEIVTVVSKIFVNPAIVEQPDIISDVAVFLQ